MLRSSMISLTAAMLLIQGCGQPDPAPLIPDAEPLDLRQPEQVAIAARFSDPLSIITFAMLVVTLHDLEDPELYRGCPRVVDESDRAAGIVDWRIEGGCEWEDEQGRHRIDGRIVAVGDANGTKLEYLGYRETITHTLDCAGQETGTAATGVVRLPFAFMPLTPDDGEAPEQPQPGEVQTAHYEIDIYLESSSLSQGCRVDGFELAYDVTLDLTAWFSDTTPDESMVADVHGRAAMLEQTRSAAEPRQVLGSREWRLTAEDYGSVQGAGSCGDYMTGTLRLEAGGDVAVLSPSAPASCLDNDEGQPACTAWSLNGEEQSELCDFAGLSGCSAGPNAPPPWAAMALLLTGLLWQRRRAWRNRA